MSMHLALANPLDLIRLCLGLVHYSKFQKSPLEESWNQEGITGNSDSSNQDFWKTLESYWNFATLSALLRTDQKSD
jgi:hypothetical protein